MLTFFDFISTIHGCSSMRQGVARRGHSFSKLYIVSNQSPPKTTSQYVPALNEVLEVLRPLDAVIRLILQLRNRLAYNIRQQVNQSCPRIHLRPIRRERETMLCHFQQRHPQTPHITRDRITLARNTLRRHVITRPNECICIALRSKLA